MHLSAPMAPHGVMGEDEDSTLLRGFSLFLCLFINIIVTSLFVIQYCFWNEIQPKIATISGMHGTERDMPAHR